MFDVVVWGESLAAKDGEAQLDQMGAVGRRLVGNRGDEAATGNAHFIEGFRNAVLADDSDIMFALGFADSLERN